MSDDDVVDLVVLSMVLTAIVGPTALIVSLLLPALRRSRAADRERPSPPGFHVVEAERPVD